MELHNLKPAKGSTKKRKRVGRGQGSGYGGTSTRGHKGAQSRSGYSRKVGFEGGQMPIHRRVPKRGFKNINGFKYKVFNLEQIDEMAAKYELTEISLVTLYENKFINKTDKVKILGRGEMKNPMTFKVNAVSESAKEAIEKAGGSIELI